MSKPTEHQVMRALVDWINENEHCCPGCVKDVSGSKLGHHEHGCHVLETLLISAEWLKLSTKQLEDEEFEK